MEWREITVHTVPRGIQDLASCLTANGFSDLVMEDQEEYEQFLEENRDYWDYIDENLQKQLQGLSQIKLYLEAEDEASLARLTALLENLRKTRPELGDLETEICTLPQTDWEESWKESYPPQPVGEKLIVLPYWLADTDTGGRLPVILDPGLTFGTGAHPSTRMVMANMENYVKPGACCLDLGSGSGILSIAALRLGAERAVGVDVDPKAEDAARQNAAYNGFGAPRFQALTGNVVTDRERMASLKKQKYDVVLVNIVADVILSLSPVLPEFMTRDTVLICSGILDTRLDEVTDALERAGLTVTETCGEEDWRCVCARRR